MESSCKITNYNTFFCFTLSLFSSFQNPAPPFSVAGLKHREEERNRLIEEGKVERKKEPHRERKQTEAERY